MGFNYVRLRLEAILSDGKVAYADIPFHRGGNVIVTDDNTQGKSTVVNGLAVALGFDDLVKGNVAALVKDTVKVGGKDRPIREANLYLEIANDRNEHLTIRRSINPELSSGVSVRRGPLSGWSDDGVEELYLGSGSYIDTKGFHRVLSEFIGFPFVRVTSQDDTETRLYLEYVFSAVFIEQKRGWADIMANMPFYRVREPKKTTISELIGLDYIRTNFKRNELKGEELRLRQQYENGVASLKAFVNSHRFSLRGVPTDIAAAGWNPKLYKAAASGVLTDLEQLVNSVSIRLAELNLNTEVGTVSDDVRSRLEQISDRIISLGSRRGEIENSLTVVEANIRRYRERLKSLKIDLQKNKEEMRIRNLFHHDDWSIKSACPVCEQRIDGTLLSQIRNFPTMSIEENVKYITDQRDLIESIILVETAALGRSKEESEHLSNEIDAALDEQISLQKSLSGEIPSELMARAREIAKLEGEQATFKQLSQYSSLEIEKLKSIFDRHKEVVGILSGMKNDLSTDDQMLLRDFQTAFRSFLSRMGFNSVEVKSMIIDQNSFTPRILVQGLERRRVRADFGTSASDWIRIITAFVLALHACRGNSTKSIHPNVTVFDEPAQQNMNKDDTLHFYGIVADIAKSGAQIIVAATDKDHSVRARARQLGMHVVDFGQEYVLALQDV